MDLAMFSQIAEITDALYLSSAAAVKGDKVRKMGITHIINVTMDIPNLRMPNVECIQIHVEDVPSAHLGIYFDRCADKINQVERMGGRTLVHCVAGVSRSASLCIAYLMKYQHMSLEQAYKHCKHRRPVIHPNHGFWKQLVDYERRLFGRNTIRMVQSSIGWIPDIYRREVDSAAYVYPGRGGGGGSQRYGGGSLQRYGDKLSSALNPLIRTTFSLVSVLSLGLLALFAVFSLIFV